MLQTLRDKSSGWIATVIIGLLTIPFAFFGIEQYMVQRTDMSVATVEAPPAWWSSAPSFWPVSTFWEREQITQQEFREAYERYRQRAREQQGDAFDARAFESAENKREVLDSLIDQRVQKMAAKQAKLTVSDAMVVEAIREVPAFQVDGKFDQQRYQLALASQVPAQTPRQFEQLVRDSLQQSLMGTVLNRSNFLTAGEMSRLIRLLGEKRDIQILTVPAPPADTSPVSDAQISAWYASHSSDYRAPETVSVEYVELDASTLPAPPPPEEAALRQRFQDEQKRFTQQQERLASHILIKVDEKADDATRKAAEQKAAKLAEQARAPGADFAALARASSEDEGSRDAGGDLGWVSKGAMAGPFEDALFAMSAGEVSAPVKTDFGWHVIQLRELRGGAQQTFEQARETLAREQAEADRERAFNEVSTKLVDAVLKNPSSLGPAAREVGLNVQKAGPFVRGQAQGVLANPAVTRAVFSESLIQDGTVSDPIEVAPNHDVLVRVTAHTPERTLPLAQVRDKVIAAIRADRVAKAAEKQAEVMIARINAGETIEAVATSLGLPAPMAMSNVPRGAPLPVGAGVGNAAFAVPAPAAGKATAGKVVQPDGSVVLFAVTKVTPGSEAEMPPPQREMMQQQLAQVGGMNDVQAWVRELRQRMKVRLNEANL